MQIQIRLRRNREGISVNVRTAPGVEDLFKYLVPERGIIDVGTVGRYWAPMHKDNPLYAYPIDSERIQARGVLSGSGLNWSLLGLGQPIVGQTTRGNNAGLTRRPTTDDNEMVNLSMLRLRGTSNPEGVTFRYHGILGDDQIKQLAEEFHQCSAHFYNMYLRDVDLTLRVSKED